MRGGSRLALALLLAGGAAAGCSTGTEPTAGAADSLSRAGGDLTVFDASSQAFSQPAPNLTAADLMLHAAGDERFDATFVTAPAPVNPGLGPLYVNTGCTACHVGDGRGRPPNPGEDFTSLLIRLSVPGTAADGGPLPAPDFGLELQNRATQGYVPEAVPHVSYQEIPGSYADGTPYSLRQPTYTLTDAYTNPPAGLLVSPRVAPPVFGLGLLESVPESEILENADPSNTNRDGISGRPNYVTDPATGQRVLGRFGWKAAVATVLDQVALAYDEDIGVTSRYEPEEPCASHPTPCAEHAPDVSDSVVQEAAFYVRTLGVPARRLASDPTTTRGAQLFTSIGCAACHRPTLVTAPDASPAETAGQVIHPYTDLLLHDMGPGLADNRPDYGAGGSEWRTAPLWGIGLTAVVDGHTEFLHDGRARNLAEAILWHGGEADSAAARFRALPADERAALLAFLNSL